MPLNIMVDGADAGSPVRVVRRFPVKSLDNEMFGESPVQVAKSSFEERHSLLIVSQSFYQMSPLWGNQSSFPPQISVPKCESIQ